MTSNSRTAGCGPACPVVWQGRLLLQGAPYADSGKQKRMVLQFCREPNSMLPHASDAWLDAGNEAKRLELEQYAERTRHSQSRQAGDATPLYFVDAHHTYAEFLRASDDLRLRWKGFAKLRDAFPARGE